MRSIIYSAIFLLAVTLVSAEFTRVETQLGLENTRYRIFPLGLTASPDGSVYISESGTIKRISPDGADVTLVAGSTELGNEIGDAQTSAFRYPNGLAIDRDGTLYIVDTFNHQVKKLFNGVVTLIAGDGKEGHADGVGSAARFNRPQGCALDGKGNLYVADAQNDIIRKINLATSTVTTYAGQIDKHGYEDGELKSAKFNNPFDLAYDINTNTLYVSEPYNGYVRGVRDGRVFTVAGNGKYGFQDGAARQATFNLPRGLAVGIDGTLYVADSQNHRIRAVKDGKVTTVTGNGTAGNVDGTLEEARVSNPLTMSTDGLGNIVFNDKHNHAIRRLSK